jgi:hypothetical protein
MKHGAIPARLCSCCIALALVVMLGPVADVLRRARAARDALGIDDALHAPMGAFLADVMSAVEPGSVGVGTPPTLPHVKLVNRLKPGSIKSAREAAFVVMRELLALVWAPSSTAQQKRARRAAESAQFQSGTGMTPTDNLGARQTRTPALALHGISMRAVPPS